MNRNIFQQQIVPDKPKILPEERIYVYIPTATSEGGKGLASFNSRDFSTPRGHVSLKWPMEMVINLADPTVRPSMTKVLSDEFVKTGSQTIITNPVTGTTYNSNNAEVKLNRDNRDAYSRPELVMLESNDFSVSKVGQYNKYGIKKNNPLQTPSLVQLDNDDFLYTNDIVKVNWPYGYSGQFGLMKIAPYGAGSLGFDNDNNLQVDINALKLNFDGYLDIRPTYTNSNPAYIDENGLAKRDMNGNTILDITKAAVGLGVVENRTFASRTYDEFGNAMKTYFDNRFGLKLDKSNWDGPTGLFRDWNPSTSDRATVQRWFQRLELEDESIWSSLRTLRLFLGVFATVEDLESVYPANEELSMSNAFILNTNSYWAIREVDGVWEWFDTEIENLSFFDHIETDPASLKPNAPVANVSVGTSGKWIQSDHVHPSDPSKLDVLFKEDGTIDITTLAPTENDFFVELKDVNMVMNIPYIRTAQFLHNWKKHPTIFTQDETSNEYYWGGNQEEFESLDLGDIPNGAFLNVDDEFMIPGHFVTEEQINNSGLSVNETNERFVIVDKMLTIDGVPLVMKSQNGRKNLEALNFGDSWGPSVPNEHRMAITIPTANGLTLSHRYFTPNRMIRSDIYGNLTTDTFNTDNIVLKSEDFIASRVIKSTGTRQLQSWNSGSINNAPIVSNGSGDIKTLELSGGRIVKTDENGGLQTTQWVEDNIIKSGAEGIVNVLAPNRLAMTGLNNTLYTWVSEGVNGSLIVRGNDDGQIRVRVHNNQNRILYTGANGTVVELGSGTSGQLLKSNGASAPGWVDAPTANVHLPQTVFTSNPSEIVANALQGLAAVFLGSAPAEYRNNCIYYIG